MRNHARPSSSFNAAGRPATADRAGLSQCRWPGRAGPRVVQLDEARRETAPACRAIGTPASVNDVSPYSMRLGDTFGCLRRETRFPLRATYPPSYYIICDPVSILPSWLVSSPTWIRFITAYRGSCKWCDGPRICSLPGESKIFRFHWLCKLELSHIYRLRCFLLRN